MTIRCVVFLVLLVVDLSWPLFAIESDLNSMILNPKQQSYSHWRRAGRKGLLYRRERSWTGQLGYNNLSSVLRNRKSTPVSLLSILIMSWNSNIAIWLQHTICDQTNVRLQPFSELAPPTTRTDNANAEMLKVASREICILRLLALLKMLNDLEGRAHLNKCTWSSSCCISPIGC